MRPAKSRSGEQLSRSPAGGPPGERTRSCRACPGRSPPRRPSRTRCDRPAVSTSSTSPLPKTGTPTASLTRAICAQSAVALVLLAAGAAVNGDRRDAGVLQGAGQLGGVDRGRIPAEAHLHGDRNRRPPRPSPRPPGRSRSTSRASAAPLPRLTTLDTGHPRLTSTSTAPRSTQTWAASAMTAGSQPTSWARDRRHLAREIEQMQRRVGAAHHRLGGDHLGRDQAGAELAAQLAAGRVGDPDHGRHQHRRREFEPADPQWAERGRSESHRPMVRGRDPARAQRFCSWISRSPWSVSRSSTMSIAGISVASDGGQAAGGDHLRLPFHLLAEASDQALDQPDVAEHDARLHARRGRVADRLDGGGELHPDEHRRVAHQRVVAELDAGGDRAAEVVAPGVDGVEGRRRAEVHEDGRTLVEMVRRDARWRSGRRPPAAGRRSGCGSRFGCPGPTIIGGVSK